MKAFEASNALRYRFARVSGRQRWLIGLATALLLCAGCGGEEWTGTVEERDGVLYVSNPREGIWQSEAAPPLRFELEQTFGVDREPAEAILAPIDAVEVDGDGAVYVLSSSPSRLVAFDGRGNVRWSSDRRGQGPGDLSKPYGLAWDGASIELHRSVRRRRTAALLARRERPFPGHRPARARGCRRSSVHGPRRSLPARASLRGQARSLIPAG